MLMTQRDRHVHATHSRTLEGARADRADGITTQVVRNALNTAANQMKRVLIRTAFSPVIYEAHDFAVAIYDREMRLLSQAPTLPAFMGTMSFCVEGAVAGIGGEEALNPGDVILYNKPFGTGSHAQDMAVVVPVYHAGELVAYAASKAHLIDIGAKDPYCTDSVDMFQEGLILDGVKLYRNGELVEDVLKILLSNSRTPSLIKGDLLAEVGCCQAGAAEVLALIDRFGWAVVKDCIERMYDHGEMLVRDFIRQVPDGVYTGRGHLDDDGLSDDPIHFEVKIIVEGEEIHFDLSDVPEATKGPLNTPLPSTVSACRIVLAMLAGNESPNEGHFRPLKTVTRPGSMFHPVAPQPTFLYGWPLMQLVEALFEAFSKAMPGKVPSGSAGDVCGAGFYTFDPRRGETVMAANPYPIGLGAFPDGDGATLMHLSIGQSSLPSAELIETKFDFIQFENWEIVPDSGGIGKYRGGSGWRLDVRVLRDINFLSPIERTKEPSWAQAGGESGAANKITLHYPDGRSVETKKVTGIKLPKGTLVEVLCGGGGGFGNPRDRDPEAVRRDIRLGFTSEDKARRDYPHAFA